MPEDSSDRLTDEQRACLHAEAARCVTELAARAARADDPRIDLITAAFERALPYHQEQFRTAGKPGDVAGLIKALRAGEFAFGRRPDCDLWADIALASLLAVGDESAIALFKRRFDERIEVWAWRYAAGDDEIAGDFPGDLLFRRGDRGEVPSRIATYRGRSPLDAWLKQVFLSISDHRRRARKEQARGGKESDEVAQTASPREQTNNPADLLGDDYDRQECTRRLAPVFLETFASLESGETLILKMIHLDGVPQKHLAEFLKVDEGTITRRRQKAERTLRDRFFEAARSTAMMGEEAARRCLELIQGRFAELLGFMTAVQ